MTEILLADNLATLPKVQHCFFTRVYGNPGLSRHEERDAALAVRRRMANDLSVAPDHLLTCYQIHSSDVALVTHPWSPDQRPKADALVTDQKGIALGVLTADCVPVLFADAQAQVIGAAHAGWRGALGGILEATLAAMEGLGARRTVIQAALGPCIWQNSYEVGPEFLAPFLAENPTSERFFCAALKTDRYRFDLPGYVTARLASLGVRDIERSPADTCADPERFFSHRYSTLHGEERNGNLMSAIALI
jgi:YfiH family protein